MTIVKHRSSNHIINPKTETLIIGTFNPDTPDNKADFFYGRSQNYFWRLLPTVYGVADLKKAPKEEKLDFIKEYKTDLIDLIKEVKVDEGEEANYDDCYIDCRVTDWKDIIGVIDTLTNLKRVCFTRKTFSDIPAMKKRIDAIKEHCKEKGISFEALITPARYYNEAKQIQWTNFLTDGKV